MVDLNTEALTVEARVELELEERRSFLVEAGAGSGKTHTLVHGLRYLLGRHRNELERHGMSIACITYTNVAKRQISERIGDDPLVHVRTIHEFLWSQIGGFQQALRRAIPAYNSALRNPADLAGWSSNVKITYSDRGRRLSEGEISHDDVLALALQLVASHPKLVRLITGRYPFILVDEYQDTAAETIKLLLDHLADGQKGRCVVGLFGDSMQKIYRHGVGVVDHEKLTRITKHENYRCAEPIVAVLNKIRPELPQKTAGEPRTGEVHLFLPTDSRDGPERLKVALEILRGCGWSEPDTRYLMLTHRGIAGRLEYANVLRTFTVLGSFARDTLLDGTHPFAQYMLQIEALCFAFDKKDHAELARLLGNGAMTVTRHSQKTEVSRCMWDVIHLRQSGSIGEVFDFVHERRLLRKPRQVVAIERCLTTPDLDEREQRRADFARDLREIPYVEAIAYARFVNEQTPFTTQHGVKGDEFENVVVVIDDKAWNQYDIGKLLSDQDGEARLQRSRNLFYVCCSRARRRLGVVFMTELSPSAEATARDWFASGTVHV